MSEELNQPAAIPVAFDAEQQRVFDAAIAAERRKGEAAVEAMRATAAAAIKAKLNITDAEEFLAQQADQGAKDAAELGQLEALFSDGKKSNALFLRDKTLWKTLKAKRDALQGRPVAVPPKMGSRSFRPNNT